MMRTYGRPLLACAVVAGVLLLAGMGGGGAATATSSPTDDAAYLLSVLPPVAAPPASGSTINAQGHVAGFSVSDGGDMHATEWVDGVAHDLGALGGPGSNSAVLWPVKNNHGVLVGISQTDRPDPRNEPWSCSAFLPARPGYACRGFVWTEAGMRELPTLGGTHGFATAVNNRDQIVGWAETSMEDPSCTNGQQLQFLAVLWTGLGEHVVPLPPLPADSVSSATGINDRGRIVGISGACNRAVGRLSARAAVVWDHGVPHALPDLGGIAWNTPMSVNERGDVAGFLNRSAADGTALRPLPVWWTAAGELHPLPVPEGYTFGQALGINGHRGVVGVAFSEDFSACAAVRWSSDRPVLLRDLVDEDEVDLCSANDINDRGQITGTGTDIGTGATVAFLADPTRSG